MHPRRSPMRFASCWFRRKIPFACSALLALPAGVRGQDEAIVEPLAAVLAAEDARRFDPSLFRAAARDPSPIVRRHAALALGRIGNRAALDILIELTSDPDTTVQLDALFALGLLGHPDALDHLRQFALDAQPGDADGVSAEAITAIARTGGARAAELMTETLNRWVGLATTERIPGAIARALGEAWRLGDVAPVTIISLFTEAGDREAKRGAIYSLARLRNPAASTALIRATEDRDAYIRSLAVRALDAAFADSAGIDRSALATRVERLTSDVDSRVRVNALRALGTYGGHDHLSAVSDRAADSDPVVRVQATMTLGELEGDDVADALRERLDGGVFATRRAAVLGLARVSGANAIPQIIEWMQEEDWPGRVAAAQALGSIGRDASPQLCQLLSDEDPRVVAMALDAVLRVDSLKAESLAVAFARHPDPVVLRTALGFFERHPDTSHVNLLAAGYARAVSNRWRNVEATVVRALGAISALDSRSGGVVRRRFLAQYPENDDYLVRRVAEQRAPDIGERWGPWRPIETGRAIADYRDLVREILLPAERKVYRQTLVVETDRGNITIELYAADAPLTVYSFLELADRRYFDGGTWHRVVPNFVVQGGDPRGDGRGEPGLAIRDEVSRHPYPRGAVGVARGGPDSGGSQFFITHGPQPHLEGSYTVFGRVRSGLDVVDRLMLGDRIRRVRRQ